MPEGGARVNGLTRIDDGPVATVYTGLRDGGPVALKVFPKRFDKRTTSAFQKEQAKLATVRRVTSILMVDGVEELPTGEQALRMELCTRSLAALVERVGQLAAADAVVLGRAMAMALAAAHGAGVVHGGVAPNNVLFRTTGEPVLADFGVTLRQAFTRDPLHAIEYLPPETLRTGTLNEATDLYGLGAVLHFALSGRSPHPGRLGEQPGERVLRILGEPVPAITRSDVPTGLSTLVARLLSANPDRRPPQAAQVAEQLTAMLPNPPKPQEPEPWDDFDSPTPPPHRPAPPPHRDEPQDWDDFAAQPWMPPHRPVPPRHHPGVRPAFTPGAVAPPPAPHPAAPSAHPAIPPAVSTTASSRHGTAAPLAAGLSAPATTPDPLPTVAPPTAADARIASPAPPPTQSAPPGGLPGSAAVGAVPAADQPIDAPADTTPGHPPATAAPATPSIVEVPAASGPVVAPVEDDVAGAADAASSPAAMPGSPASPPLGSPPFAAASSAVRPVADAPALLPLAPAPVPAPSHGDGHRIHVEEHPTEALPQPQTVRLQVPGHHDEFDFDDEPGGFGRRPGAVKLLATVSPTKQKSDRRLIRYDLLAGAALLLALLAMVPLLLLRGDPEEMSSAPQVPEAVGGSGDDVEVVLDPPVDMTDKVRLNWTANRVLDYGVVVAVQGGKEARVTPVGRVLTTVVDVVPGRRYCFQIQATEGDGVYTSEPVSLRGATCKE